MTEEERLEKLCYEADRHCLILKKLEDEQDWGELYEAKVSACEVFWAIYEMTLRQDPPREARKVQ